MDDKAVVRMMNVNFLNHNFEQRNFKSDLTHPNSYDYPMDKYTYKYCNMQIYFGSLTCKAYEYYSGILLNLSCEEVQIKNLLE